MRAGAWGNCPIFADLPGGVGVLGRGAAAAPAVLQDLDAELRRGHKLAVTEFDVPITLFNAPGKRPGMPALARRAMLSPAGTTHLVTRLERDGLVRREAARHWSRRTSARSLVGAQRLAAK